MSSRLDKKYSYDQVLIAKYKKQLKNDAVKKIRRSLLDLTKNDISCFKGFEISIVKNENKEENNDNNLIVAPRYFLRYLEDFKRNNNNNLPENAEEDTPVTVESNTINDMQIDSSDFEDDDE